MRVQRKVLVLAISICLVAVGCGDDDESAAPPGDDAGETILADLHAAAIVRLLTVDNSFGPDADPFDTISVGMLIGADADRPLESGAFGQIETELGSSARVERVDDVEALITELFDENAIGTAVASIEDVRVDGDRAELDMRLWCGSLCGVFLTYEAERAGNGWEILGTTGPIAVS